MLRTRLTLLTAAGVLTLPASALAADAGQVKIALASPAKGSALPVFGGTTVATGRPATATRSAITLPVRIATLGRSSSGALGGTMTLRSGRRALALRGLRLTVTARATRLSGRAGSTRATFFESRTGTTPRTGIAALTLRRGALKLTPAGARLVRARLRRTIRAGTTLGVVSGTLGTPARPTTGAGATTPNGTASPGATPPAVDTPGPTTPTPAPPAPGPIANAYTTSCLAQPTALPAAGTGTPPAAPEPALTATHQLTSATALTWGVRESWRWYLRNLGGLAAAWDGATLGPDIPGPAFGILTFPGATPAGAYEQAADPANDRLVARLRGRVDFCHGTHGFRITLANPTVIIDGANSRVAADADTNHSGVLDPNVRVDVARLDLTGITPARTATTVTWSNVPATFLEGGSVAFSGSSPGSGRSYPPGAAMDPLTIVARLDVP